MNTGNVGERYDVRLLERGHDGRLERDVVCVALAGAKAGKERGDRALIAFAANAVDCDLTRTRDGNRGVERESFELTFDRRLRMRSGERSVWEECAAGKRSR